MLRKLIRAAGDRALAMRLSPLGREVRRRHLTYLGSRRLLTLERCVTELDRKRVAGDYVETGIALGGSAILLASWATRTSTLGRSFHGFDVFGMIPPPGERDGADSHARYEVIRSGRSTGLAGDKYYGYDESLYDHVVQRFASFGFRVGERGVYLHPGLFENTLEFRPEQRIALAHIDCDWHDPVATCLARIDPHLSVGGCFVVDDYHDYEGCRTAVDAFLAKHPAYRVTSERPNLVIERGG